MPKTKEVLICVEEIKRASLVLRAINHPLRRKILSLIKENERLTVTEIYTIMELEQSVASQHLGILRKFGMVTSERSGKYLYYCIEADVLKNINHHASAISINKA
jgi:DNA-binding transcriptional ArsR family regulator